MNVLLHKKLHFLLLAGVFWLGIGQVMAQTPTIDVFELDVLMNETYSFQPIPHFSTMDYQIHVVRDGDNGDAFFDPASGLGSDFGIGMPGGNQPQPNYLHYTPNTGFLGYDQIVVQYQKKNGSFSITAYNVYNLRVVPSYLYAESDYAATDEGQAVTIDILNNDYGNGTDLTVSEITNVNKGTAANNGDDITFTPAAGFHGVAHLNYTICDAQGSCDMATVSICVIALNPATYDSIHVTTERNAEQVILMELDSNYTVSVAPTLGSVDTFETLTYIPNQNAIGTDKVIFVDATNNRTRVFEIEILDVDDDNILLFDEVYFTPKDETIEEISVLDNDNAGPYLGSFNVLNMPNTAQGGQLTPNPAQGLGAYIYEPPAGFTGIDQFTYKAKAPGTNYTEYATCYIVVNNLNPELPVIHITSPKNTPLVLGDHLPFVNYEYAEVSSPDYGNVDFYAGEQSVTSQHGQEFEGTNMLVYDPDVDATGADEFEISYCAGQNTNCPVIKVVVDVVEITNPQSPTICGGPACVWPGDTDKNGKVDIRDILPIGLCMGEVGEDRENASVNWYGQYSDDWSELQARGLPFNGKHIDTDGNAIVSAADTAAIGQFYGNYSNLTPVPTAPISPLPFYIDIDSLVNIEPGAVIYAPIHLGNDSIPAFDAYGLTFEIEYDPALFEEVNVIWNETAWMQYNSPVLSKIVKPFDGKVDAGYTRTSGASASGHGIIGVAEFIVIDDVSGFRKNSLQTTVNFNTAGLMTSSGETYGLNDNSITFALTTNEGEEEATLLTEDKLVVFPNPAQNNVTVHLNGTDNEMERIMLYDVMGQAVYDSGSILAKRQRLDVSELAIGVYVMKVWSNGEMLNKKIEVIR